MRGDHSAIYSCRASICRRPASQEPPPGARVAELVSHGRSNRQVARELFVAVHTVEANLSCIYRKLGVRSRAELAHRLTADRRAPPS